MRRAGGKGDRCRVRSVPTWLPGATVLSRVEGLRSLRTAVSDLPGYPGRPERFERAGGPSERLTPALPRCEARARSWSGSTGDTTPSLTPVRAQPISSFALRYAYPPTMFTRKAFLVCRKPPPCLSDARASVTATAASFAEEQPSGF